jgi:hypothetical protein
MMMCDAGWVMTGRANILDAHARIPRGRQWRGIGARANREKGQCVDWRDTRQVAVALGIIGKRGCAVHEELGRSVSIKDRFSDRYLPSALQPARARVQYARCLTTCHRRYIQPYRPGIFAHI